ncbi:sensor histidine kinase [Shewanella pneumatophori]|uniref:histidine kinase n=1 Tax=Shewanella pneumatophori TaxID=314092 RepID=A0A9X1ZE84_9GAMM|nr:ATP-binding protein [Shewanella pneumatophori]MCL1137770.1 ATP-binding protein [Shewanella pneumatophori]
MSKLSGFSLSVKLVFVAVLVSACGLLLALSGMLLLGSDELQQEIVGHSKMLGAIFVVSLIAVAMLSHFCTRSLATSLKALEVGLLNFKDNDFSVNIPLSGDSQLKALASLFNESAQTLRRERQYIYQRELLLDKVIQSSPNVMLLLDDEKRVIYANDAARHLFNQGVRIEGMSLTELLQGSSAELVTAMQNPKEGLFSLGSDTDENDAQTWHLSRGQFLLNGQFHHLILLKQMTRELNRQEVAVWKKVIRIISHELNNSVAPIASMVNSGRMITKDLHDPKLELIFNTIEDRTRHLSQFIFNYARFAKLPLPTKTTVDWQTLIAQLKQHYQFKLLGDLPETQASFDLIQMEQVLLNLLKNAHESGSDLSEVSLEVKDSVFSEQTQGICIEINDAGSGMSADVLRQALLPFYSTKQSGTGLGLPLCREIIEAHDGRISLHNREDKGLCVSVWLPQSATD